jgi:hypothetical protein
MKVPIEIDNVTAADGVNILYKDGSYTEIGIVDESTTPTKAQYLIKYAFRNTESGEYWYKVPENEWHKIKPLPKSVAFCGTVYDPDGPKNPNFGPDGFDM